MHAWTLTVLLEVKNTEARHCHVWLSDFSRQSELSAELVSRKSWRSRPSVCSPAAASPNQQRGCKKLQPCSMQLTYS